MHGRLFDQIREIISTFDHNGIRFVLIGDLALASHKVVRATQNIDLLVDADDADRIDELLADMGYQCLYKSDEAGNYIRNDERIDLLYASRPIAQRLLNAASEKKTAFGNIRVVSTEGLIGFKLQAITNNPKRTQDMEDIRALLRNNKDTIDMNEFANTSHYLIGQPCSMNYSDKSRKPDQGDPITGPAFPDNVIESGESDPYERLAELMAVVEALCPEWPERDTFKDGDTYLL